MTICRTFSNMTALAVCTVALIAGGLFSFIAITTLLAFGGMPERQMRPAYARVKRRRPY